MTYFDPSSSALYAQCSKNLLFILALLGLVLTFSLSGNNLNIYMGSNCFGHGYSLNGFIKLYIDDLISSFSYLVSDESF